MVFCTVEQTYDIFNTFMFISRDVKRYINHSKPAPKTSIYCFHCTTKYHRGYVDDHDGACGGCVDFNAPANQK